MVLVVSAHGWTDQDHLMLSCVVCLYGFIQVMDKVLNSTKQREDPRGTPHQRALQTRLMPIQYEYFGGKRCSYSNRWEEVWHCG